MCWRSITVLITTILVKTTLETCMNLNSVTSPPYPIRRIRRHLYPPLPYYQTLPIRKRYIHCQEVPLSSNFHTNVDPLLQRTPVLWLEVNNTNSPEIAAEAFSTLQNIPELRISGANVQVIQVGAFNGLSSLSVLSLTNNKINHVKEYFFKNLSNLEEIDLSFNNIDKIDPTTFAELKELKKINLGNNFISFLSFKLFIGLTSIQALDISFNKLTNIDSQSFKDLINLQNLWLNNNNLVALNTSLLVNNQQLKVFYINDNNIRSLCNFTFPKSITEINVSENIIQQLHFSAFVDVKLIDFSKNGIARLDDDFFSNINVRFLYLNQNYLGLNPISDKIFSNLTNLELLSLSKNQIAKIPSNLFRNNTNLKQLTLSDNYLSQLSDVWLPTTIEELNLTKNSFNSNLNLTRLVNLKYLDVSFNNLTAITFHFFDHLSVLNTLNLNNNKISGISLGCFRDLKILKHLDLSHNKIVVLEIGVFVGTNNLLELDISHNELNALNEGVFHNLKNLQTLKFAYNNVSFVAADVFLSHMGWLQEVDLAGNRWSCSVLTTFIKNYRRVKFINGGAYNVTNVNGIACKIELKEASYLNGSYIKFIDTATSQLATNNILLTCITVFMLIIIILKSHKFCFIKRKVLSSVRSEQELQLI